MLSFKEGGSKKEIAVSPLPFSLGRSPENQLVIPDPKVSRYHCQIVRKSGRLYLVDLGSSNGTLVNGVRVTERPLADNDTITLGETSCIFKEDAPSTGIFPPEVLRPLPALPSHNNGALHRTSDTGKNLLILYQIARSIVCGAGMKDVMDMALTLILQAMNAERGVILVVKGQSLVPVIAKYRTADHSGHLGTGQPKEFPVSMTIAGRAIAERAALITSDARYDPRFSSGDSITSFGIRSALCAPLWEEEKITGAIYLDSLMTTHAFTEEDLDILTTISHIIAMGLRQELLKEEVKLETILRSNLERFLSPEVVDDIMKRSREQDRVPLEVQERVATILFADIKDFTSLSERLGPIEVANLLNGFFTRMSAVIFRHEGSVNKYIGDAIMAIFGAPISHDNDPELAVRAAVEMLKELANYNLNISENKRFAIRIGINTGKVVAGNIGSTNRMEYTVLGDAVNIASRLENSARPNQIIIGEDTYKQVKDSFATRALGMVSLKGKMQSIRAYEVITEHYTQG